MGWGLNPTLSIAPIVGSAGPQLSTALPAKQSGTCSITLVPGNWFPCSAWMFADKGLLLMRNRKLRFSYAMDNFPLLGICGVIPDCIKIAYDTEHRCSGCR